MRCPRCRRALARVSTLGGLAWDCAGCRGRFALLPVWRSLIDRQPVDRAWREAFWGRVAPGASCPGCGHAMAEVTASGTAVRVDVCRRCQAIWFDGGEAARMPPPTRPPTPEPIADAEAMLAIARVRGMAERQQLGEAIGGGGPDEAWKVVAGALGLPVEMGTMSTSRRPWTTWALCAAIAMASTAVFVAGVDALRTFAFIPAEAWRWGGLTALTAFFVHGGIGHLVGNLYFLWLCGDNVEDELGPRRFLVLVLAATLGGALAHGLGDARTDIPCVGASGGIAGVMAAYVIAFPRAQIGRAWFFWFRGLLWLRLPAWAWFIAWIGLQLWLSHAQVAGFGHVSGLAHLGGAAAGAVLWFWWSPRRTAARAATRAA